MAPKGRFPAAQGEALGAEGAPNGDPRRQTPVGLVGAPHDPEARYRRVRAELERRKVPTLAGALCIEDDEETALREPTAVARRLLVLSAVTYRADGGDRQKAVELIEQNDLWEHVTPEERSLLEAEETDPDLSRKLLWRLEGLWILAWALGELELPWPAGFCDVSRLTTTVMDCESREDFVANAKLRPKAEVLDARQLTLLQHWTIRDAFIHQREIPIDLDWSGEAKLMPVRGCPTTGAIAERHHTLNWLVLFGDADWDDVDTPT